MSNDLGAIQLIGPLLAGTFELRVVALGLLVGGGMVANAAAVFVTRAYSIVKLKAVLRRSPKVKSPPRRGD